ncbi:hypothetical protein J6S88_01785 [bacterium]|nr:hypothetical protein [bacterium]
MLVNFLGQLNAIRMRNAAAMGMMSISEARMSMIRNMHPSFGANLQAINAIDTQMEIDFQRNSLLYQIACAQEEALKRRQQQENKRFDTIA